MTFFVRTLFRHDAFSNNLPGNLVGRLPHLAGSFCSATPLHDVLMPVRPPLPAASAPLAPSRVPVAAAEAGLPPVAVPAVDVRCPAELSSDSPWVTSSAADVLLFETDYKANPTSRVCNIANTIHKSLCIRTKVPKNVLRSITESKLNI